MTRASRLTLLAATGGALGVALWTEFPLCPMASSFGIPCPGCGLTRATLALLRGDMRTALQFHPLVWLLAPLFVAFVSTAVWELLRNPARPRAKPRLKWVGRGTTLVASALLVLTLSVWLARFAGYFGGPVPVTTLRAWLTSR